MPVSDAESRIFAGEGRGEAQVFQPSNAIFGALQTEQDLLKRDIAKNEQEEQENKKYKANSAVGPMSFMLPKFAKKIQRSVEQYDAMLHESIKNGTYKQDKYDLEQVKLGIRQQGLDMSGLSKQYGKMAATKYDPDSYNETHEYVMSDLEDPDNVDAGELYFDVQSRMSKMKLKTVPVDMTGVDNIAVKNYEKTVTPMVNGDYQINEFVSKDRASVIAQAHIKYGMSPKQRAEGVRKAGSEGAFFKEMIQIVENQYPDKEGIKTKSSSGNGTPKEFDTGYAGASIRFENPTVPGSSGKNHQKYGWVVNNKWEKLRQDFASGSMSERAFQVQVSGLRKLIEHKQGPYYKEMLNSFSRVAPLDKGSGSRNFRKGKLGTSGDFAGYPDKIVEDENGELYVEVRSSTGDDKVQTVYLTNKKTGKANALSENLAALNKYYSSGKNTTFFDIEKLRLMLDEKAGKRETIVQNNILPEIYKDLYEYELPANIWDHRYPNTKVKSKDKKEDTPVFDYTKINKK